MFQGSYDLVFNSDSVTVVADTVSADSQVYNNISAGIGKMTDDVDSTILLLPIDQIGEGSHTRNEGTNELKHTLEHIVTMMKHATHELSDACALVGLGVKGAVEDFDSTESNITQKFKFMMSSKPVQ